MAAGQLFARNPELAVGLAADREDDRVVEPLEVLDLDVVADLDVAEEAEAVAGRGFFVDPDHRLDLRMVRGDAAADEAERRRQAVEEIDLGVQVLALEDVLGGVEAGGAGADDGDAQGIVFGSDLAHGERERIGNSARRAPTRRAASRCSRGRCRGSSAGSSARLKSSRRLRRLLDLDPLAVDFEAVAPAAHLQRLVAARRRPGRAGAGVTRAPPRSAAVPRRARPARRAGRRCGCPSRGARPGASQRKGSSTSPTSSRMRRTSSRCSFTISLPGDVVPERAAEAAAGVAPAVLLGEAVVALVDPDQVVVLVDRVAERLRSSCSRGDGAGDAVERVQRLAQRERHAGEDRGLELGELA